MSVWFGVMSAPLQDAKGAAIRHKTEAGLLASFAHPQSTRSTTHHEPAVSANDLEILHRAAVPARVARQALWNRCGFEVGFHGVYREIVHDERIVSTEVFEGMPEGEAVDTMTLTEHGERTTLTILVQHQNTARDAHIESGMEGGLQDALDLLEQVAMSLP